MGLTTPCLERTDRGTGHTQSQRSQGAPAAAALPPPLSEGLGLENPQVRPWLGRQEWWSLEVVQVV